MMIRLEMMLMSLGCVLAHAQVIGVPDETMPLIFAGQPHRLQNAFSNSTSQTINATLHARLWLASSATTIPLEAVPMKPFPMGPGQTVVASTVFTFPRVKAATRFLVQWTDNRDRVLAMTDVLAYPDDLLRPLKSLGGNKPLLVFDPQGQLQPLLAKADVEFRNLTDGDPDHSTVNLAVVLPFDMKTPAPVELAGKMVAWAKSGKAVVWIQPSRRTEPPVEPSAYAVPLGGGTVIVAQHRTIAHLAEQPLAQLNLIRLAEWAVNPDRFGPPPIQQ